MFEFDTESVRNALAKAGITGTHRSHKRRGTIEKIDKLLAGDPDATFGLSGVGAYTPQQILSFMSELTGCPADITDVDCDDWIDPDLTIAGIVAAAERLRDAARTGATLLVVTGHPTGMLEHHMRVVDHYAAAGGKVLRLRENESFPIGAKRSMREVRYNGGVGCLADWGQLLHTHESAAMEALLEAEPWPDLVLGDHGFAGAAIERGIPTIAVMDINDHALAVARAQGRDVTIVPMDDNRLPHLYEPSWSLFGAIIAGANE
ncbi:MAG: phosphatase [Actinobacteria bacterium]|nr:phosphatase [Actinomycetota bacterium]